MIMTFKFFQPVCIVTVPSTLYSNDVVFSTNYISQLLKGSCNIYGKSIINARRVGCMKQHISVSSSIILLPGLDMF